MTSSQQARPTRTVVVRSVTAIGAVAALAAAFVAGTAYGPDRTTTPSGPATSPLFLPASAPLQVTEDCDALLADYRERGVDQVTEYGWPSEYGFAAMPVTELNGARVTGSPVDAQSDVSTSRVTTSETGTNVQEVGVDEPDVAKTNGRHLFTLNDGRLVAYDVSSPGKGAEPERLATLRLPDLRDADGRYGEQRSEILLAGDRLVAIGAPARTPRGEQPDTRVVVVDVSDAAAPAVVHELTVDARVDQVRLHDGVVRLVLASDLPDLDFVTPDDDRTERSALRHNRELVEETTLADWLPTLTTDDGDEMIACDRVAVPDDEATLGTTSVVALDPTDPAETRTTAVAAASDITYASADRLILAQTPPQFWGGWARRVPAPNQVRDGSTQLWSFELDGMDTTYAAAGTVDGRVADRWSLDAAEGTLRVAVGETVRTGNFNSVVTLEEVDGELVELGRLDKLGVNEDIKAVRWFDDLALVVTFRQVDPLYAVDLSDPADPTLLAELKIPGFSEYLHPLGTHRMIGMGQDANPMTGTSRGAQASLFDVSDLRNPRRLDTVSYPRRSVAGAAADPRQFLWVPEARTALTVVSKGWQGRTGWLSQLHLAGGRFHETRTEVEYGTDVDRVRLVPLPDVADHGRVVLVTADGARYVDVA